MTDLQKDINRLIEDRIPFTITYDNAQVINEDTVVEVTYENRLYTYSWLTQDLKDKKRIYKPIFYGKKIRNTDKKE